MLGLVDTLHTECEKSQIGGRENMSARSLWHDTLLQTSIVMNTSSSRYVSGCWSTIPPNEGVAP